MKKAGLKQLINAAAIIHAYCTSHISQDQLLSVLVRTTEPGCQTDGFLCSTRGLLFHVRMAPGSVSEKCHVQQYFFSSVTFKPNFERSADSRLISKSQNSAWLQEEKAAIWVWDLSASTSVPFRGSLQPSVVGISLSWWRERHCCGTIPAMKPSVFLTGIVFHLLKHSGSSSSGNLWSTKVKLARTPGFYPNCTLLLSQVPPEHGWLSKCSPENAPAQPSLITSEGPGSREK